MGSVAKKSKKDKKLAKKVRKEEKRLEASPVINERLNFLASKLSNVSTYSDLATSFSLLDSFKKEFTPLLSKSGYQSIDKVSSGMGAMSFGAYGITDLFGFQPQSTQFFKVFPNPLAIYAYLADKHWAVINCRNEFYKEIITDGYYLVGNEKEFDRVQKILDSFHITDLRPQLFDYLKVYGNFWIWPKYNAFGGLKDYDLLLPQYLIPIPDASQQIILGWQYQIGWQALLFEKDELLHQKYRRSMQNYNLSNPPLGSLLVDIEADIAASGFNNMVFQKGGLWGLAVLMETAKNQGIPGASSQNAAKQMAAEMNANHSGGRAAYETVVFQGAKDVKSMGNLGDMDGAFHKGSDKCAKQIAHVLGVPHERLGIITNANQQYHAASLEDKNALQFDKTIMEGMRLVDNFINTEMLPRMGIFDVQLRAKERYNAFTGVMARALLDLAKIDGLITKDQALTEFMRLPPIGGSEGAKALRVLPNVSVSSETVPPIVSLPVPTNELPDPFQYSEDDDDDNLAGAGVLAKR